MKISQRIRDLAPRGDDGWGVFYRARTLVEAGHPITELTIGEHDIGTDPSILAAINVSAEGGHTGYASVPGVTSLRQAVADRVTERTGVPTTVDNVIITAGGQAALFAAHFACCAPGKKALFIDPFYATYPGTIRAIGGVPAPVPTSAASGFRPTYQAISELAEGADTLLVNTPNNPTGAVYDAETLGEIARACIDNDLWLISDEVYDTQVWEGEHLSPRAQPGMEGRTLVIGSMSKSHAMTGSRVGWVVGPTEVIDEMITLATNTTYGVPGYIQDASLFALNQGTEMEEKVAAPFKRRRAIVLAALEGQNLLRALPTQGAMYTFVDISATGIDGDVFANRLLDERQIAVMPGGSFGQAATGCIRIAMTVEDAAFAAAMAGIVTFAQTL